MGRLTESASAIEAHKDVIVGHGVESLDSLVGIYAIAHLVSAARARRRTLQGSTSVDVDGKRLFAARDLGAVIEVVPLAPPTHRALPSTQYLHATESIPSSQSVALLTWSYT
jgi:hypothetical protein